MKRKPHRLTIALAAPCYKRPDVAITQLKSAAVHLGRFLCGAAIYLQPEDQALPPDLPPDFLSSLPFPVLIKAGPQAWIAGAKNRAAALAMSFSPTPDLLWITDDDVTFDVTTSTHLSRVMKLAMDPTTGCISPTARKGSKHFPANEDLIVPLPYIGNGCIIRPSAFNGVHGFREGQIADEKDFGLSLYLSGYTNYRTRRVLVNHKQGSGHGGVAELFDEVWDGMAVDLPLDDTEYNQDHPLLQCTPEPGTYRGRRTPVLYPSAGYKFTDKAKTIHERARGQLMAGRPHHWVHPPVKGTRTQEMD